MPTETPPSADVIAAALLLLPPRVRAAILEDTAFPERATLGVDAVITVRRTGAEFARSRLFQVVRQVFAGALHGVDVEARDGTVWHVNHDGTRGITVTREGVVDSFPEFACLAPDGAARIDWFKRQTNSFCIGDERSTRWLEILADRPLEDEELDEVLDEFRLTPMHRIATIRDRLRRPNFSPADLVPGDLRYFDLLVGEPPAETKLQEFLSSILTSHVRTLIQWNSYEGLRAAFALSSHQMVSDVVDLTTVSRDEVGRVFQWLTDYGDRISQVGAIECGLRHLDLFPDIEPCLAAMTRALTTDDPEDPGGRLKLLSGLVVLVEGEVTRRGIARRRPPFWRRLASIAHAALLEREVLDGSLEPARLADWALKSGGVFYYMQSLVDLRQEPRWFPDFISPKQLRAEFLGRIATAAERHRKNIRGSELSSLLWGEDSAIRSQTLIPYASLPGPLEGGLDAVIEVPAELESSIKTSLEAEELTSDSFIGLVNSSLIFRTDSQLSELAAQGLSRVGYQFRKLTGSDDPFSLLNGLAIVSAVTRSTALANEVRTLCRVARRRAPNNLPLEVVARVALVAAAASNDLSAWTDVVGDWLTELALADMSREEAIALQGDLSALLHIEPLLWGTCGRAEAALSAFLKSLPDDAEEDHRIPE